MKQLNKIFTEKQVTELSDKVLKSFTDKLKEELGSKFYDEMSEYLYEHYNNAKDKIEYDLIKEVSGQFITSPKDFKYKELRDKIWDENKNKIVEVLTDEKIKETLQKVLMIYTHNDYGFNWQWKDGIVKLILSNWDNFKNDDRIKQQFGREIDNLKSQINSLQSKLNELSEIID